jgi:hypothetical protein
MKEVMSITAINHTTMTKERFTITISILTTIRMIITIMPKKITTTMDTATPLRGSASGGF